MRMLQRSVAGSLVLVMISLHVESAPTPVRTKARLVSSINSPVGRSGLSFCPEGRRVITTGPVRVARILDARSGDCLVTVTGHIINPRNGGWMDGSINAVAMSRDGKTLATAGFDAIRLWDAKTGKSVGALGEKNPHRGACILAFSPDGKTLASGGHEVCSWDLVKSEMKTSFKSVSNYASVAFTKDGMLRAAATDMKPGAEQYRRVVLYHGADGKKPQHLRKLDNQAGGVVLSQDGLRLVNSAESVLHITNAETGKEIRTIEMPKSRVLSVAFSPDHSSLAVNWLARDGKNDSHPRRCVVKVYDTETGKERCTLSDFPDSPGMLAFGPKGDTLAIEFTYKPLIQVWELPTK